MLASFLQAEAIQERSGGGQIQLARASDSSQLAASSEDRRTNNPLSRKVAWRIIWHVLMRIDDIEFKSIENTHDSEQRKVYKKRLLATSDYVVPKKYKSMKILTSIYN